MDDGRVANDLYFLECWTLLVLLRPNCLDDHWNRVGALSFLG